MNIKGIIKEYFEKCYAHQSDNLNKMEQFLERHNLPKFTQEEINHLDRPIYIKDIASIINNLPKQKAPSPDGFIVEFYQTFKEKNHTNPLQSLPEYRNGRDAFSIIL